MPASDHDSILSHGERDVARRLREREGDLAERIDAIAKARGVDRAEVQRSVERIREKTERALATLEQSPFTAEAAADLDPERRERILAAIDGGE